MKYWLMKSEPNTYALSDLKKDKSTCWEGVRNYQARNFMRDEMKKGDLVLFYHSNAKPPGIAGIAEVLREAYPDHYQWKTNSKYYDAKAKKENPRWFMVDLKFKKAFTQLFSLEEIKGHKELSKMMVAKKGCRLSIQPVEKKHFELIQKIMS